MQMFIDILQANANGCAPVKSSLGTFHWVSEIL